MDRQIERNQSKMDRQREIQIDREKRNQLERNIENRYIERNIDRQREIKIDRKTMRNIVRQILKSNNYLMHPIRKSNGYTKDGKKKYLRYFVLKKIKSVKEHVEIPQNA